MITIKEVIVYLDNNVPEYMHGILRVSMIQTFYNGEPIQNNHNLTNIEFHTTEELKKYVSQNLNIDIDNITIE